MSNLHIHCFLTLWNMLPIQTLLECFFQIVFNDPKLPGAKTHGIFTVHCLSELFHVCPFTLDSPLSQVQGCVTSSPSTYTQTSLHPSSCLPAFFFFFLLCFKHLYMDFFSPSLRISLEKSHPLHTQTSFVTKCFFATDKFVSSKFIY